MIDEIFDASLSITANCIVFAYSLFASFRTRFRYSYFKTAMLAALLTAITLLVSILFLTHDQFFSSVSTVGILLWIASAVLIFHVAIQGSSFEILFIVLVILNLYVNIAAVAKVMMIVLRLNISDVFVYSLFRILVLILCTPLIWVLLGKLYRQVIEFNMDFPFWRFIWAIPTLFYLVFFTKIIPDYWKYPIEVGRMDVAFVFVWATTTYAVFSVTLLMLIQNYKGVMAGQQTRLIATQLKMQETQYEKLLENIESTARLRHDWRHHLLTINGFVENGRMENLQSYLDELNPFYMNTEEVSICENHVVDVILCHYMGIAKEHDIDIAVAADIPKELNIANTDLCVIFGNLVENAVEACIGQEQGGRVIEIKAEITGNKLALLIKNTYQKQVIQRGDEYDSTKHEGVGIGLSSVDRVVKNNRGAMKISHDEKYFRAYVLLNI